MMVSGLARRIRRRDITRSRPAKHSGTSRAPPRPLSWPGPAGRKLRHEIRFAEQFPPDFCRAILCRWKIEGHKFVEVPRSVWMACARRSPFSDIKALAEPVHSEERR